MNLKNILVALLIVIVSVLTLFINFFTFNKEKNDNHILIDQIYTQNINEKIEQIESELGYKIDNFKSIVTDRVGYDPFSVASILVGIGSDDGIIQSCQPTYKGILLGEVEELKSKSAKIKTIQSIERLVVNIKNNRGILSGSPEGIYIDQVPSVEGLKVGDDIFSAPAPEFAVEIYIGKVSEIESKPNSPFSTLLVDYSIAVPSVNHIHFICPNVD